MTSSDTMHPALSQAQFPRRRPVVLGPHRQMSEEEGKAAASANMARILAEWKADPSRDPGYTTGTHGRNRGRV